MTLFANDPLTQLAFSMHENKGVFALLLGSGLSRAAEIPTGWEITIDLIRRVALAQGIEEQPDWEKWYKETTGHEPNYSTLVEELASTAQERRSILHSYIEPTEEDREEGRKIPTEAHRAIADLVRSGYVRVIITTNFDRLMENGLREAGVEPTIVASTGALVGAEPITHSSCYLIKLHGDYKDARILNTASELDVYPPEYDRLLNRVFDEYGLIVSGWSGEWDHALRAAFLRAPNRRYPLYWAARGGLRESAKELIDHRRARVVPITDADSFFIGLWQRVETLEHSRRHNPISIDLLINTVKRLITKAEHRIQLVDLIAEEADSLVSRLTSSAFSTQVEWSTEELRSRVERYEAATEPLARVAGILGRWGDGSELPLMLDLVRSLYQRSTEKRGGLNVWLDFCIYPAVLIVTALGLGMVRGQRWATLHQLMSAPIYRPHGEQGRIVDELFAAQWGGETRDWWKEIEGLRNRKTPCSDHLIEIFWEWGKGFYEVCPDFKATYGLFEVLGALGHLEQHAEGVVARSVAGSNRHKNYMWMPVGCIGWDHSLRRRLINEITSNPMKAALIKSGFASGSIKFLELFVDNLERVSERMNWY